jgi:hypothetical protein
MTPVDPDSVTPSWLSEVLGMDVEGCTLETDRRRDDFERTFAKVVAPHVHVDEERALAYAKQTREVVDRGLRNPQQRHP